MFYGIEFDRQDAPDGADYLFGSKKKKKARAEAAQNTINAVLNSPGAANLSNAAIMSMVYGSDGKLTGKEKRAISKANRQEEKTNRTTARQDAKTDRTAVRQAEMTERTKKRQDSKTDRTGLETASVAGNAPVKPESGVMTLDPVANQAGSMIPGSGSAMPMSGGGGGGGMDEGEMIQADWNNAALQQQAEDEPEQTAQAEAINQLPEPDAQPNNKSLIIILVAVAAVLFFLIRKK